ncbi:hypothetical protein H4219_001585 [Mycoemilia scoparia]|uniref:Uncharacterized protein n=1 Tax=Mycoemilia scoparia TaxID=417184 RepID=A0A9W8A365_9FUNG|nr:hypothetical protein H4219_001585 [Mycoemilia scoparia]
MTEAEKYESGSRGRKSQKQKPQENVQNQANSNTTPKNNKKRKLDDEKVPTKSNDKKADNGKSKSDVKVTENTDNDSDKPAKSVTDIRSAILEAIGKVLDKNQQIEFKDFRVAVAKTVLSENHKRINTEKAVKKAFKKLKISKANDGGLEFSF